MKPGDVPPTAGTFELPPEEALAYFRQKGLKPSFAWQDMAQPGAHAESFTIAKMMDIDMLGDVRKSLDEALATGKPFKAWAAEITPMLQAKGWWGRQLVTDPKTGEQVMAQLGSAARLETIFRTNLQSAYAAGKWDEIVRQADDAPYLMYDAIDDFRVRHEHKAWDGTVLPVFSEWWKVHYPPAGWNCRCGTIQLSEDELEAMGLKVSREPRTAMRTWKNPRTGEEVEVPVGVDPGFGNTPSPIPSHASQKLVNEKVRQLPQDLAASANLGLEQTAKQIALETQQRIAKQVGAAAIAEAEAAAAVVRAEAAALAALEAETLAAKAAALEAEVQAAIAAAKAEQDAAAAQLATLGKAAPTTTQGKVYQQLAKAGALDGDPVEALGKLETALAEAKASHQKATLLGGYKQKAIAGKLPSPAQQEAFATLAGAEQEALLVEVKKAQQKLAAAEALAAQQAAEAAALQAAKEAAAIQAAADAAAAQAAAEAAAAAQAQAEALAAKVAAEKAAEAEALAAAQVAEAKAAKKAAAAAKKAAKKQAEAQTAAAAVESTAAPKSALKAATTAPTEPLDGSLFTQVGPQEGTNPGGSYIDSSTGTKWYVKFPKGGIENARNEGLTANLYELAGVPAPEYRFVDMPDGRRGIASKWIDGLEKNQAALIEGVEGVADGFGADAWLANWDVVGQGYDNLKVHSGTRAMRVDTGGGLVYRAQGTPKGAAFGDRVIEIDSLRDASLNPQAAAVFGKLTPAQIEASVARVLRVPDAEIARVVDAWGPTDLLEREALKRRLIARKADLWERYPAARPGYTAPAPVADAGARVTAMEQQLIEQARVNGYAIRTDKDLVEDQHVLLTVYAEETGDGKLTRGTLKLLEKGDAALAAQIAESLGGTQTLASASELDDPILELVKGINSRAAKGGALEAKTIARWEVLKKQIDKQLLDLGNVLSVHGDALAPAQIKEAAESLVYLQGWQQKLVAALRGKTAADAAVAVEGVYERGKLKAIAVQREGKAGAVLWQKSEATRDIYGKATAWSERLTQIDNGYAVLRNETQVVPGVSTVYRAEVDGVRVTYVPFADNPQGRSFHGTLQIDVQGSGADASARVFGALEKLGLNAERAEMLDRQELFLNRLGRLRTVRDPKAAAAYAQLNEIGDQAERVKRKTAHLSELVGRDITKSEQWGGWQGEHQAFGHGRTLQYRPDFDDDEFNDFAKSHVLFHNPTGTGGEADAGMAERIKRIIGGGGQMASISDRVRRGIPIDGSSVSRDVETGGGNYVYTRLINTGTGTPKQRYKNAGIYFSPQHLRRMDAISYQSDQFGATGDAVQQVHRRSTLPELREIAAKGGYNRSNETIFKDGLSFFDDPELVMVMPTKAEYADILKWLKDNGYARWPDGRALTDVILPPP